MIKNKILSPLPKTKKHQEGPAATPAPPGYVSDGNKFVYSQTTGQIYMFCFFVLFDKRFATFRPGTE
jgi:hypothetical protein